MIHLLSVTELFYLIFCLYNLDVVQDLNLQMMNLILFFKSCLF